MLFLIVSIFTGCSDKTDNSNDQKDVIDGELLVDADEDSYISAEDCDDGNANINPSAEELCDELTIIVMDRLMRTSQKNFMVISDGDGYGNQFIV